MEEAAASVGETQKEATTRLQRCEKITGDFPSLEQTLIIGNGGRNRCNNFISGNSNIRLFKTFLHRNLCFGVIG